MWHDSHTIMQYAMIIRFVLILAITLLGLSVGALTLMLRRWLHSDQSQAPAMRERRLT